jgi:hypothetical protein
MALRATLDAGRPWSPGPWSPIGTGGGAAGVWRPGPARAAAGVDGLADRRRVLTPACPWLALGFGLDIAPRGEGWRGALLCAPAGGGRDDAPRR